MHTGECIVNEGRVEGVAVHIAARVADLAAPGQVLVSQTVRDLVAGSGIKFEDQGLYRLKGIEDEWHVFGVVSEQ